MVLQNSFVVVDIETTGLSRHRHNIIEIAAVRLVNGKIDGEFQSLVNPERKIPRFITKLTGIDDEMVKNSKPIKPVIKRFCNFLKEDDTLVAHCATFDYGFLNHNGNIHLDKAIKNNRLCTRNLANRLLPDLPSKKLGRICEHFNIVNESAHRAMADVKATAEVFLDIKSLDQVLQFLDSKNKIYD